MKKLISIWLGLMLGLGLSVNAQMQMERLDRGAIAVRTNQGYYITWRLLGNESYSTSFNIYKGSTKLNAEPITATTTYLDETAALNSQYYVKAIVNNIEIPNTTYAKILNNTQGDNAGYFDIPINLPPKGPNGGNYNANDASTGDLNGDGEYDIVLKWDPDNSKDNSQSGITDNVLLDGYTMNGKQLWRIDLGPNIRAGAHYTQFLVFDFDGNGKAEIMCKTAPGTRDASGNYLSKGPAASADHSKIYRNKSGYVLSGPEYLTVFDGETGLELATADYWPLRGNVSDWGDSYGNRLDRYNATVAYVDGKQPSAVFQRGYYTRLTMAAWNWRNGELKREWTFDSNTSGNGAYFSQGNHSIHVIDANGDGLQDLVTGSSVISGTGLGMHTSGMGHGDACHVTYMKKDDPRPMIYMCHEEDKYGVSLRYADNGEIVFQVDKSGDIGRGCAGELDPAKPGFKFWASGLGLYDTNGSTVGNNPSSINFVIWWDGNLSRDLMNSNRIDQWHVANNSSTRLLTADNATSNNGTKATPALQADLLGDWREEVILRLNTNRALRVFTSIMPTNYKLYTFMHDPVYRADISGQNSSYNQPPHPGFYVASDMDFPPPAPNIKLIAGLYRGSGNTIQNLIVSDIENSSNWSIADSMGQKISIYGNETLYSSDLPNEFIGTEWIKTSTDSKTWMSNDTLATFEVTEAAMVSIFHSEEVSSLPEWLKAFDKKEVKIIVSSPVSKAQTMVLYEKKYAAGNKVVLGPNSNDGASDAQMYFVVARKMKDLVNTVNTTILHPEFKAYPTESGSITKIQYYLERSQKTSIGIYDLSGKLMAPIDSGQKQEGMNYASIDTSIFPGGIYIIKLVATDFALQQKIILMK
ncbi:MAG: T9SS type A sorting domain-containing protein [Prolixibacteraceae bacterium]